MENNQENPTFKDGFAGDRRFFKGFLAKMELIFMIQLERFQDDQTRIIYIISRLYGDAMNWAATLIENQDPCLLNYDQFIARLKSVFGNYDATFIANQKLRTIKQRRVGDIKSYILEFNKYADDSSWNEEAKMDAFLAGLNDQIATRILEMFPGPQSLFAMQTIASRIDSRISAHRQFAPQGQNSNSNSHSNNNKSKKGKKPFFSQKQFKSKQRGPLSQVEKDRRRRENLCFYCGSADHKLDKCPFKNKNKNFASTSHVSNPQPAFTPRPRVSDKPNANLPIFEFTFNYEKGSTKTKVLLDSGSQINLIDIYFIKENNIPYSDKTNIPEVSGIGGLQNILGETLPITLNYNNHKCETKFYVMDLPSYCAILGSEWLCNHNPTIDFKNKKLKFMSNYCIENCLSVPSTFTTSTSESITINETNETNNMSDEEIRKILPAKLLPFKDVFDEKAANKLPPHRPYDCEINLKPNAKPHYGAIYPLTEKETLALKEYIKEARAKGFIRNSKSPFGASVFFVPKKDPNDLRLVVDYRPLNESTIRDSYPLPLINDMLENLSKGKVFSKLDLRSAYNLVRIKEGDEYKTAFTCKFGHFEYLVMPFGLKNAPAVFQHFINDVFEDIIGSFVYCYIDDIIVFSPDMDSHFTHLIEVLKRLRKAGLYAKLEKCEFCVPFLDFLGHRISSEGIFMDPKKVSSILEWPTPKNVKELQSFLGLANYYRRFIPSFAAIAHPLHCLLKKNAKFYWSTETQDAFDNIKSRFSSAPVLAYPNRELPFMVETDSSNFAIGAILSQTLPSDNKVHPVAFFSRSLNSAERNYPIYDKELLAIVDALEHWRHLLKGTDTPFTIFSDHRNLLYQKKPEKMTQRLVRWSLFLSEFNFKIVYRAGSNNGKPDALSRRPDYASNNDDPSSDVPFTVLRPENFCAVATIVSSLND